MKISIYQMKTGPDTRFLKFSRLDYVKQRCGGQIPEHIYECVFSGEINTSSLDEVYCIFNNEHPAGFSGHSLSISDVICVMDTIYYYCDHTTFIPIKFDASKCIRREEKCVINQRRT